MRAPIGRLSCLLIVTVAAIFLLRFAWPAVVMLFAFAGVTSAATMVGVVLGLTVLMAAWPTTAPVLDTMTRNAGVIHEITLRDEEVCDISLATFHVFDKEGTKTFQAGERPVTLGQACCL